jgi:uncharacterized cupredoxin-like copper-binding protein
VRRPTSLLVALAVAAGVTAGGHRLETRAGADAGPEGTLGPGRATVVLDIHHSLFSEERITVRAGTLVRFVVRNDDPIHHELVVGPPEVHAAHAEGTEPFHPPVPGEVSVGPNASGSTVYRFDEPGTVTFACHLPGHVAHGMVGEVEVVPSGASH